MSRTAPQLTKRQHYVPQFYLNLWSDKNGRVVCHDLSSRSTIISTPENLLLQRYFYESDRNNPDNRVENVLSTMEGRAATAFNKITTILAQHSTAISNATATLRKQLTTTDLDALAEFSAYQYLRVPGAIAQKRRELQPAPLLSRDLNRSLNPGHFTESGYAHMRDRFTQMKLLLMISPGRELVTSDRPCFDMKDSNDAPLLGEDIGQDPDVICYLPLAPRLGAVFYHARFNANSNRTSRIMSRTLTDGEVKNLNTLVIQQAEHYVIAPQKEDYIFKVASKRKKARLE